MASDKEGGSVSFAKRFLGVIARPKQTFEGIAENPVPLMGLLIFGIALALSVGITFYIFSFKIRLANLLDLPAPVFPYGLLDPGVNTPDYSGIATGNIAVRVIFLLVVAGGTWLVAQVFKTKQSTFTTLLSAVSYAFTVMVVGAIVVTPLAIIYPERNIQATQVTYEGVVLLDVSFRGSFFHAATVEEPTPVFYNLNNSPVHVSRAIADQLDASDGESVLTGLVLENVTVEGQSFKGNITVDKAVLSGIETEDWANRFGFINSSKALASFGFAVDGNAYVWDKNRVSETGQWIDGFSPPIPETSAVEILLNLVPAGLRLWIIGLSSVAIYVIYGVGVPTDRSARARIVAVLKLIAAPVVIVLLSLLIQSYLGIGMLLSIY